MLRAMRYASPLGLLTLTAGESGICALVMDGQRYEREHLRAPYLEDDCELLRQARYWLDEYFAGKNPKIDFPLTPEGTAFQKRVWRELTRIPYGSALSYGELAARLNSSARAVGAAVGRNPISILIPCHRVLGKDGRLTGYAGGLERKAALLRLEGAVFRDE